MRDWTTVASSEPAIIEVNLLSEGGQVRVVIIGRHNNHVFASVASGADLFRLAQYKSDPSVDGRPLIGAS